MEDTQIVASHVTLVGHLPAFVRHAFNGIVSINFSNEALHSWHMLPPLVIAGHRVAYEGKIKQVNQ